MYNKVKVNICNKEYIISTSEEEAYVLELASKLDKKMTEIMNQNDTISMSTAAILSALTYLDEGQKATESSDNMREQIKNYLEDAASATLEAQKSKMQLERASERIEELQEEIYKLKYGKRNA